MGCGVWGLGFGVSGSGLGFRIEGLRFWENALKLMTRGGLVQLMTEAGSSLNPLGFSVEGERDRK